MATNEAYYAEEHKKQVKEWNVRKGTSSKRDHLEEYVTKLRVNVDRMLEAITKTPSDSRSQELFQATMAHLGQMETALALAEISVVLYQIKDEIAQTR